MFSNLYSIIAFSSFILGMLTVFVLLFANLRNTFSNRLLTLGVFTFAYFILVTSLVDTYEIMRFPHLFRSASPLIYLFPPTIFLYVRSTLQEERSFQKLDWLHFLPAALHFLEMLPFYLKPAYKKKELIQIIQLDLDNAFPFYEGMLPPFVHTFLKLGLGLAYLSAQFWLIRKYLRQNRPLDSIQQTVVHWLNWLTLTLTICYGLILLGVSIDTPRQTVFHVATVLLGITMVSIVLYLFLKPQILYRLITFTTANNLAEDISDWKEPSHPFSSSEVAEYKQKIEQYLNTEKPFLDTDFRMRTMVDSTGIPRHHLSALINSEYDMNFSQFINEYRINYVIQNFDTPEWANLTLEGIGREAGFYSRSTFLAAFKKITGMTPKEYRKKVS